MAKQLDLDTLSRAVSGGGAAFRSRVRLQPAGGEGTKVFPPTYAGSVYATEKRRLPDHDDPVECVLLDSVQSQANRMEDALQQAVDSGRLRLPIIEVDFTPYFPGDKQPEAMRLVDPVGKISSLQAPHRIADAILRDSLWNGVPFRKSEIGNRLDRVSARDATALFEYCPTTLLLGMWDSTGPKGGLGVKFERAMVGEIVGINAVYGVKTSSRIDPLGILKDAGPLYRRADGGFTVDPTEALDENKDRKSTGKKLLYGSQGKPSEANHGNVAPSVDPGGVTISHAEQTIVLSLPALRRLRFPVNGKTSNDLDDAGRTVLAALGLCAASLAAEAGLDLRSRCLLWPVEPLTWNLLGEPGEPAVELALNASGAIKLLEGAVKKAAALGLKWQEKPVVLTPSDSLVKLVVKSQKLAAQQGGEAGEGGE